MAIDLSKYVGQEVICEFEGGFQLNGVVELKKSYQNYSFEIVGMRFSRDGKGFTMRNIKNIQLFQPKTMLTGIAQKAPNINLEEFGDQKVYVKLNNGIAYLQRLEKEHRNTWTMIGVATFTVKGICPNNKEYSIEEIYGEGAYEIKTKSTFDEPEDKQIKEAKQLLSQMTEEQIAKLLKSINT